MKQTNNYVKNLLKGQTVTLDRIYDLVSTGMNADDAIRFVALATGPTLKFVKEYTDDNETTRKFISVDYLRMEVKYSYMTPRWYKTQEDADKEVYDYKSRAYDEYPIKKMVKTTGSTDVDVWPTEE